MKVKLLQDARIRHKAGEIVEVSPVEFDFLVGIKAAEFVEAEPAEPKKKKATKK